jgi:exodeoxyribonuclease VII small subunit
MSNKKTETLQEKINRLSEMVAFFDADDFDIEQALEKYKEAEKLSEEIRKQMIEVKNEITVLKERFDKAE